MSDIIAITDSNKNIVAEYRYDPWGKVLNEDNLTEIGVLNPFRYRSYYYDSDIKMYYLQSRYYDAEVGRFINCDDVSYIGITESEITYNPFAYCENNPMDGIDVYGYWAYDVHAGYHSKKEYKGITYGYPRSYDFGYNIPYYMDNEKRKYYGTYYWALKSGFKYNKISREYAVTIAKACNDVDIIFSPISTSVSNQSWHFDTNGNKKIDSRIENAFEYIKKAEECFEKAMKAYKIGKSFKKNVKQGCIYFGYAMHALQDSFAHTKDKCYYIIIPSSKFFNNKKEITFWMHLPGANVDTASERKTDLKKAEDTTIYFLECLFKTYRQVLIRR